MHRQVGQTERQEAGMFVKVCTTGNDSTAIYECDRVFVRTADHKEASCGKDQGIDGEGS
jgi:hypothetical protein